MTILLKDTLFSEELSAIDLKKSLTKLQNMLEQIPDEENVLLDFDADSNGTNNESLSGSLALARYIQPEPEDDLNGDGIPDNIPPHMLPYVRSILQLKAQNASIRASMLDIAISENILNGFVKHLMRGTLTLKSQKQLK